MGMAKCSSIIAAMALARRLVDKQMKSANEFFGFFERGKVEFAIRELRTDRSHLAIFCFLTAFKLHPSFLGCKFLNPIFYVKAKPQGVCR